MTVPFAFNADGSLRLSGVGVTLFTSDNDDPNGELVGLQAGDLCITTEPNLYQWNGDGWVRFMMMFEGAPTVTGVSPIFGTANGGDVVTITGTNFTDATSVLFGATPATNVQVVGPDSIIVTTPAHDGTSVDVHVVTPVGTSATGGGDGFIYDGVPTVAALSPLYGAPAGGTTVTITGTGFLSASEVRFGDATASFAIVNDATIIATSPAVAAGMVDITITNPTGTSATVTPDQYVFGAIPVVTGVSPTFGSTAGGNTVTVTGVNFDDAISIEFEPGNNGSGLVQVSPTELTVIAPSHIGGQVDLVVTNLAGTSDVAIGDGYIYDDVPTLNSVTPSTGTSAGGTTVAINGTGYLSVTAVHFGGTLGTGLVIHDDSNLSVTSPTGTGTVDVAVTNPTGTSTVVTADHYTYT